MFGVEEPDYHAAIEIDTGKTILFPTKIPEDYKIWMFVPDADYLKKKYEVDEILYVEDIENYLKSYNPTTIYFYNGINSDSDARPALPSFPIL